ncbi:MAG TPA: hypothetical protein VJA87_03410 [Candidatus Paceibacterota bacterium]
MSIMLGNIHFDGFAGDRSTALVGGRGNLGAWACPVTHKLLHRGN